MLTRSQRSMRFEMMLRPALEQPLCREDVQLTGTVVAVYTLGKDDKGELQIVTRVPGKQRTPATARRPRATSMRSR